MSVPSGDELGSFVGEFTGFDGGEVALGFAELATVLGRFRSRVLGTTVWADKRRGLGGLRVTISSGNYGCCREVSCHKSSIVGLRSWSRGRGCRGEASEGEREEGFEGGGMHYEG